MTNQDVYQIIAQKLVSDSGFLAQLQNDPRAAIEGALASAGVTASPRDVNNLVKEYSGFVSKKGADQLSVAANTYIGGGTQTDVV